jgi:hypothetical protein
MPLKNVEVAKLLKEIIVPATRVLDVVVNVAILLEIDHAVILTVLVVEVRKGPNVWLTEHVVVV